MKFSEPELECTFEIPEPLSYRLVLRYDSEIELAQPSAEIYERLWRGLRAIAINWECKHLDLGTNLDDPMNIRGIDIMKWAALMGWSFRRSLKDLPLPGSPESCLP